MTIETKENLPLNKSISPEILQDTEKSLSNVEKETRINFFKKAGNRIKNLFSSKEEQGQPNLLNNELSKNQGNTSSTPENMVDTKNKGIGEKANTNKESQETAKTGSDKISNEMFEQLLKMEGKHKQGNNTLVAKTGKQFGEKFTTGPFGMVYKHIDNEGNLLKKAVPFKEGEEVTEEWGRKNAKACYDKRAKEIKEAFNKKGYKLSQDQLDALTSTCGGTSKSRKNCLNYVLDNWNDQKKVVSYISTHSTTAAGNGKVQPGLVYRRKFEADWFVGNKMTFAEHRAKQKKGENTNPNGSYSA